MLNLDCLTGSNLLDCFSRLFAWLCYLEEPPVESRISNRVINVSEIAGPGFRLDASSAGVERSQSGQHGCRG